MRFAAVVAAVLLAGVPAGAAWTEGETIPRLALEDQHGRRGEVDERVRLLLFTREMRAGGIVKEALADADQALLEARRAVYVADISGMPAVVSRLFAVPAMRRRAYRVLLDRDGAATEGLPAVEGKVTVVALDRLRITRITHATSAAELGELLRPPATPDR
jgi:hypothetical protein